MSRSVISDFGNCARVKYGGRRIDNFDAKSVSFLDLGSVSDIRMRHTARDTQVLAAAERRVESPSDVHIEPSNAPESRKSPTSLGSPVLPLAAGALALAIFVIDTFTPFGMAVAVLYVIVVLMAATFCDRRGTLIVGMGCAALTLVPSPSRMARIREHRVHALHCQPLAIAITTFLILKNKAAEACCASRRTCST